MSMHACIHAFVIYKKLSISLQTFEDMLTKFAHYVCAYKKTSVIDFSLILKNKMAAIAGEIKRKVFLEHACVCERQSAI